jgi:hypothetical protein
LPLLNALDLESEVNGPIVIAEPGLNVRSLGADSKGENLAYENEVRFLNELGRCQGCPLRVKSRSKGTKASDPESGYA